MRRAGAIKYYLHPTKLHKGDEYYTARVVKGRILGLEDLIRAMKLRGTTLTQTDIVAVFHLATEVILDLVSDGSSLHTPFGNYSLGLPGRFDNRNATFNGREHRFKMNVTLGKEMRRYMKKARIVPEKTTKPVRGPELFHYEDNKTNTRNAWITPNALAALFGRDMKFDADDPEQGIFFREMETKILIKASSYNHITQSKLCFQTPEELEPNTRYVIELHNKRNNRIKVTELNEILWTVPAIAESSAALEVAETPAVPAVVEAMSESAVVDAMPASAVVETMPAPAIAEAMPAPAVVETMSASAVVEAMPVLEVAESLPVPAVVETMPASVDVATPPRPQPLNLPSALEIDEPTTPPLEKEPAPRPAAPHSTPVMGFDDFTLTLDALGGIRDQGIGKAMDPMMAPGRRRAGRRYRKRAARAKFPHSILS